MARLRPELGNAKPGDPCPKGGTAYLLVYAAVKQSSGLIHGKITAHGDHCAIGHFFDIHKHTALESPLIDEVAAVNDANPHMTARQRRLFVLRWLRWRLKELGMPGFQKASRP